MARKKEAKKPAKGNPAPLTEAQLREALQAVAVIREGALHLAEMFKDHDSTDSWERQRNPYVAREFGAGLTGTTVIHKIVECANREASLLREKLGEVVEVREPMFERLLKAKCKCLALRRNCRSGEWGGSRGLSSRCPINGGAGTVKRIAYAARRRRSGQRRLCLRLASMP